MSKFNRDDIVNTGIVAGGVLVLFGGYKLLQKVGIIRDKWDRLAKQLSKLFSRWQSDEFLIAVGKKYLQLYGIKANINNTSTISYTKAKEIAKKIYDSKGTFNDDEDKLYTNFREIRCGVDLWRVNNTFKTSYERTVIDYIEGFTSAKERGTIYDIVKSYPDFIKK